MEDKTEQTLQLQQIHAAAAGVLDGIVHFKQRGAPGRGGKPVLSWQTLLRIVCAPATLGAHVLATVAFGSQVSPSSIRRARIRVAAALWAVCKARSGHIVQSAVASEAQASETTILVQTWKFDDTEVRWRTLHWQALAPNAGSFGTTSLVQRGWLIVEETVPDGRLVAKRYPVPVPTAPLADHSASTLWQSLTEVMPVSSQAKMPSSPDVLAVMIYTADAAASNKAALAREVHLCRPNQLVIYWQCLAHQIHLSSRSQYVGLGEHFVGDVARSSHLWQIGRYHAELLRACLQFLDSQLLYKRVENIPTPAEQRAAQESLLTFLVSSARSGLPAAVKRNVQTLACKLNGDWSCDQPVHYCVGDACCSGGRSETLRQLNLAVLECFGVQPAVASAARWTDSFRSVAWQAMLLLVHGLGRQALQLMPQVQALPAAPAHRTARPAARLQRNRGRGSAAKGRRRGARNQGAQSIETQVADCSEMSWTQMLTRRLSFVQGWWSNPSTLGLLLTMLLVNQPLQHALLWLLKHEAGTYPDLQAYCRTRGSGRPHFSGKRKRTAAGSESSREDPIALQLVDGNFMQGILAQGSSIVHTPQQTEQMLAFALATSRSTLASADETLQTALLPGLAQLWYRGFYVYRCWPFRLLRLLNPHLPEVEKQSVATAFFTSPECCLDPGCSRKLRKWLLQRWLGSDASQVPPDKLAECSSKLAALSDPVVKRLLQRIAQDSEVSVIDIECRHARNRRATLGGRPPNFATIAARCYLRECQVQHAQCTGVVSAAHMSTKLVDAQGALGMKRETSARHKRRRTNPWLHFRAHHERLRSQIVDAGLVPAIGAIGASSTAPSTLTPLAPSESTPRKSGTSSSSRSTSTPSPRTKEWEQSVAAAWRGLVPSEKQVWVLGAAAANLTRDARAAGAVVAVAAEDAQTQTVSASAVSRDGKDEQDGLQLQQQAIVGQHSTAVAALCKKENCATLLGACKEGSFCSQEYLAKAVDRFPAGYVSLEQEWANNNIPRKAPASMQCPSWHRTCWEKGLCEATALAASMVRQICKQVQDLAQKMKPKLGVAVWALRCGGEIVQPFCIAHILWRPSRIIVVPLVALMGACSVSRLPVTVRLQVELAGFFSFQLLEGFVSSFLQQCARDCSFSQYSSQVEVAVLSAKVLPEGRFQIQRVVSGYPVSVDMALRQQATAARVSHLLEASNGAGLDAMLDMLASKATPSAKRQPAAKARSQKPKLTTPVEAPVLQRRMPAATTTTATAAAPAGAAGAAGPAVATETEAAATTVPADTAGPAETVAPAAAARAGEDSPCIAEGEVDTCMHVGCGLDAWGCCTECQVTLCYVHLGMSTSASFQQRASRCHEHNPQAIFCPCPSCRQSDPALEEDSSGEFEPGVAEIEAAAKVPEEESITEPMPEQLAPGPGSKEQRRPRRGRGGRGVGKGRAEPVAPDTSWQGHTDQQQVFATLQRAGKGELPAGYRMYYQPKMNRWYARGPGNQWLRGSSRSLSRFSIEECILQIYEVIMSDAESTGQVPAHPPVEAGGEEAQAASEAAHSSEVPLESGSSSDSSSE